MDNQDLRKAGLKVTLPRVKILQQLEKSEERHLSAEDIYKSLMDAGEDVGLATPRPPGPGRRITSSA